MKRTLTLLALMILISGSAISKKKKRYLGVVNYLKGVDFGYFIGGSMLDYSFDFYPSLEDNPILVSMPDNIIDSFPYDTRITNIYADVATLNPGITVGVSATFNLVNNLDFVFKPSITVGDREIRFSHPLENVNPEYTIDDYTYSKRSSLVSIPIYFKYRADRFESFRPYIIGGPSFIYDVEKNSIIDIPLATKAFDTTLDIGFGLDNIFRYFDFGIEFKYSHGLTNLIDHSYGYDSDGVLNIPYYGYSIEKLQSRNFSILFVFD